MHNGARPSHDIRIARHWGTPHPVTYESSHDKFGKALSGSAAELVGALGDIQGALPLFVPPLLLRSYGHCPFFGSGLAHRMRVGEAD